MNREFFYISTLCTLISKIDRLINELLQYSKEMPRKCHCVAQSIGKRTSAQNRRRRKRHDSTCLRRALCLFEYSFLRLSFFLFSCKKRHLVQTITPVSGAIGHQQRVKAAAITNSDSLIPFIPSCAPSPPPSSLLHCSSPHRFCVPSTLSLIFPFQFPRALLSLALCHRSPAPFTFAHYSRKSNFVTRAGSSIRARIPSSIPGKLHVGRHRRLERRFPLSSAASFYHSRMSSTAYRMSTYTKQSTPLAYNNIQGIQEVWQNFRYILKTDC